MTVPPAPPSFAAMLGWAPPLIPLLPVTALLMAAWYFWAVRRVVARGRSWHWMRTLSFLTGCLILAAVTALAVERYGYQLFSAFMFQQLTLSILVPPLLVLGEPGQLLLRSTPHSGVGRYVLIAALTGLRSRLGRWILHPGFTIPVFLFSYYGLYLSDLFDAVAAAPLGHLGLEVFFLASGILFVVPILSTGPLPMRQTNLGRFFDIFLEMPLHVFIGVVLMMAPRVLTKTFADPPPGWGVDPVADQAAAGGLAWSYGEPVAVAITLIVAARWRRDDEKRAAAREARTDDEAAELAAYNAYLQRLHGFPDTPSSDRCIWPR